MSYITVPSNKVAAACENKLNQINNWRQDEWEEAIQGEMENTHGWFWWKKNYTREEAIKRLKNGKVCYLGLWPMHDYIFQISYGRTEERVKELKNLTQCAETITISEEDLRILGGKI